MRANIAGYILAGGKGTRMGGMDKLFLPGKISGALDNRGAFHAGHMVCVGGRDS